MPARTLPTGVLPLRRTGAVATGLRAARASRTALLAAGAMALAACVDTDAAVERARADVLVAERTLDGAAGPSSQAAPDARAEAWLADGLTEDEAVALALLRNPTVRAAWTGIDAAKADAAQARLPANPTLTGTLLFPSIGGPEKKTASVLLPLADLWMLPERAEAADASLDEAVVRAAQVAVDVAAETRIAVRRALGWAKAREVALEQVAAAAESASVAARRAREGEASELDRAMAGEPAIGARELLMEAEREGALAALEVARLVGLPADPRARDVRGGATAAAPDAPLEALIALAEARRLEARAADLAVVAAEAAVARERSRAFRDLRLGFSWERLTQTLRGFAASLELPLFDRNQAQVARAEAIAAGARAERDRVRQQVAFEVAAAEAGRAAARARVRFLAEVALPQSDAIVAGAERRADAGDDALDLRLQAEGARLERRRALARAVVDEAVADGELLRAIGGPGADPPEAVEPLGGWPRAAGGPAGLAEDDP